VPKHIRKRLVYRSLLRGSEVAQAPAGIMRSLQILIVAAVVCATARATTLQHLTLKDMALQSTEIVRGHVQRGKTERCGPMFCTHYAVLVEDRWKGSGGAVVDMAVQGGVLNGLREVVEGAPELANGQEYVLFLWHSSLGTNLILGLSQGLFAVDAQSGEAVQSATTGHMVDGSGAGVGPDPVRMNLAEMRKYVQRVIAEGR
jgi:hypothetical protein